MKVQERLITDLEEEILFLVSIHKTHLTVLEIANGVCRSMNKVISLARVHETLIQLEADGLICITITDSKKNYSVTANGVATLQADWNLNSRNVYRS